MRSSLSAVAVATALFTVPFTAGLSGSTGPIPLNCDRACLEGVIDQYLAARRRARSVRLPLSKTCRYTENNQVVEVGDGFWKTAEGIGSYRHYLRRSGVRTGGDDGHDAWRRAPRC